MNIKTLLRRLVRWLGLLPDEGIHYIGGSDTLPPPLTREEEAALLERLEDEDARKALIEHNLRLVVYIARRFENTGVGIEDLISIGTIGLIKAVGTYRTDKNIKLATYAPGGIRGQLDILVRGDVPHGQEYQAGHVCLPVHRKRDSHAPAQERQPEGRGLL